VGLLLFALPFVHLHPRLTVLKYLVGAGFVVLFVEVWMYPHYGAPFTAVQYIAIVAVARALWYRTSRANPKFAGLILIPALSVAMMPLAMSWLAAFMREPNPRTTFIHKLEQTGGKHLIFTEYTPKWSTDAEWVYNGFDFNERQVMFARWHGEEEMRAVVHDYPGRKVWHLTLGPKTSDQRLEEVMPQKSGAESNDSNKIAAKN
jgi:hypothetical protein